MTESSGRLRSLLLVGCGGFIGSVLRYAVGGWVQRFFGATLFPVGTLTVNVIGCFLIGFLAGLAESRLVFSAEARLFMFIGILGGFTTFSSFGYETVQLARDGAMLSALGNVMLQLVLGLGAVYSGMILSRFI